MDSNNQLANDLAKARRLEKCVADSLAVLAEEGNLSSVTEKEKEAILINLQRAYAATINALRTMTILWSNRG